MADGRIMLIKGQSKFGEYEVHLGQIAQAFRDLGHNVHIHEPEPDDGVDAYRERTLTELQKNNRLILTYGFGYGGSIDGEGFSGIAKAPHLIVQASQPMAGNRDIQRSVSPIDVLVPDRSFIATMKRRWNIRVLGDVTYLPLGASVAEAHNDDETVEDFVANRPIDVLIPFSLPNSKKIYWRESLPEGLREKGLEIVEALYEQPYQPVDTLFRQKVWGSPEAEQKFSHPEMVLYENLGRLLAGIQGEQRFQAVHALNKAKVKFVGCGIRWDKHGYRWKHGHHRGEVPFTELLGLMRKAKIILSVDLTRPDGFCSRQLSAMGSGAALVANRKPFLEDALKAGDDVCLFDLFDMNDMVTQISNLLSDPPTMFGLAKAGRDKVEKEYSWQTFAKACLEISGSIAAQGTHSEAIA